ncbi:MAG: hypothetical protein M3Z30_05875 [Gemmatimonadota bacterium]|nr:hypothetical protein [Gemmatimonadota bacterium]
MAAARANVVKAQSSLTQAAADFARMRQLAQGHAVTASELELFDRQLRRGRPRASEVLKSLPTLED